MATLANWTFSRAVHFTGCAHIGVSVGFQLTIDIINKLLSAKVSADIELWRRPLAVRVHVDFWLHLLGINFGNTPSDVAVMLLADFYRLMQQASSWPKGSAAAADTALVEKAKDGGTPQGERPLDETHMF
jgi:hypothetical protein